MTTPAVVLDGFGYRPANARRWAVRDIDLSIAHGETLLLLGASGSGKSTILRAIAGLLDAGGEVAGSVEVHRAPPGAAPRPTGLLMQDPDAGLVLSRAGEEVAFGPQNAGLPQDQIDRRVDEALAAVGFPYGREHPVAALSGGERQRLALAGALAMRPDVLLLDEPTSMLDPRGAHLIRDAVERAVSRTGCTVVIVEHNTDIWRDLVDRVVVLGADGVVADGTLSEVSASPAARDTWLVDAVRPSTASHHIGERLLVANHVAYRYKGQQQLALRDVDVDLRAASALAIVGDNGSGKSTLTRVLGGLAQPTCGSVSATPALINGGRLGAEPHRWRATALAGRIGSVFQNPEHSFLTDTVRDELAVGPRALGHSDSKVHAVVDELLTRLRLDEMADQNPFTLSGGEQRRLSVGAAIATAPRVLVLDEPTFGQDPSTWHELAEMVLGLRGQGAAIAVATHDRRFVDAVADQHLHLTSERE
ncbi:MAG TPA: ATP-binding cassette domain-containing protein [Actinomycetes bacterium]|nr:ATP-binding cassette domain-containing protein [Actinomycetes bacterium]